ncbi:MAG: UDP-N-acetylmuramate dehydrogenase [Lachnospiraceae bacterium]|nr:UDP-N-acetylmuramate dehydrogenase [Lachnospiraceae bacterium]
MEFIEELESIISSDRIRRFEPMRDHTTFRIGGPADLFISPEEEDIPKLVKLCRRNAVPYVVIGNGSNILVGDKGIRGAVICVGRDMNQIVVEERGNRGLIHAQAGAMLSAVAKEAADGGWGGMEFAAGIPGSLGGALVMNAGAYGGQMCDILESVTVLTREGKVCDWDRERYAGGYRTSAVSTEGAIVLEATLILPKGDKDRINAKMQELKQKRNDKQPLDRPSAGSTFKRPEGHYAGKLIMDAGLAGYTVGGAQVSEKHCGFVINKGGATARDVRDLMKDVEDKVYEESGIRLEPEVRFLGEF